MTEITEYLRKTANKIRLATFQAIGNAGGGHFGGSLSVTEILTVLYFSVMNVDKKRPDLHSRDRFILSKGHGGPALYATLAEKGFFPEDWLNELDKNGSRLPKHVDRSKVPGIDVSSGALGQGLSVAVGMALAARLDKNNTQIYVVMGDGECNEGQVWEAAMSAAKFRLCNITAFVDRNKMQVDGMSDDVMPLGDFSEKWKAFGWHVEEVDGHDVNQIFNAVNDAKSRQDKPSIVIAHTIKGKGVSFMQGRPEWHSGAVTEEQLKAGVEDLKRVMLNEI